MVEPSSTLPGTTNQSRTSHVTDPCEARALHAPVKLKYQAERTSSNGDEPLTPSEQAVFELLPDAAQGQI